MSQRTEQRDTRERLVRPGDDVEADALVERIALSAHKRDCGSFDGGVANRAVPPAHRFDGEHAERHRREARSALLSVFDALGTQYVLGWRGLRPTSGP